MREHCLRRHHCQPMSSPSCISTPLYGLLCYITCLCLQAHHCMSYLATSDVYVFKHTTVMYAGLEFCHKIYLSDGQVDLQNHLSVMNSTCPTQKKIIKLNVYLMLHPNIGLRQLRCRLSSNVNIYTPGCCIIIN